MLRCLSDVENLTEAISALGKADFTGVAALEITGDLKRMRWEVINPWHLCRPSIHAPWMYNANADPVPIAPEMLEAESVILREALPMHLPAMFLIVAKRHGVQAWDAFLDKFGIPAAFFETPPGATEEEAMDFDATVQKLIGEGSGTIPSGAKLHTFETARDNTQTFEARARWCDDALLQLILGGKLTMTTEAGSGTLAGNAHQESFERLCAATARSISECINRQFCRRILREAFPDQPQLALFDLSSQKKEDLTEQAQLIATLSSAGFRPSPETVSEMMGFEVEAVEPTPATPSPFSPGISPITNSATASDSEPNFPIRNSQFVTRNSEAEPPLTQAELAALQSLSKGFAADQLEADADTIYTALADAIAPEDTAIENEKGHYHPDGRECPAQPGNCRLDKQKEVEQDSAKGKKKTAKGKKEKEKKKESSDEDRKEAEEKKEKQPSSYPQNWKPLTISERMTPDKAKEALKKGITATDPLGNKLTLDESILKHWEDEHKSAADIAERLAYLPVVEKCIKHPAEIREQEDGTRFYLAAYNCPKNKRIYPMAFTVPNDSSKIKTYFLRGSGINSKRKGKLLYEKAEVTPDA